MRGIGRRALACAATTAAGIALLGTGVAQAQKPEKVGNGVKTGQLGVQMFNYGTYISNGGNTGDANPVTGVSAACATSTTQACRMERLERLFAFLQSKGVTNIELFGHAGFPALTDTAALEAYRALMDKYGIHAGGWHGSMNEATFDQRIAAARILGADYIGSGGVADPGINSYSATLASAQALNRMGKKSVEAGVGPVYIHNHEQEFLRKYTENGVLKSVFEIIMDNTDPRYVVAEIDVFWSSDAFDDVTGQQTAAMINKYPSRVQLLHIKDGINVIGPGRSGSPRPTGTGEVDFRPIFQAANNRVRYYHQEQDGGTTTDANTSLTNLKGVGPASVATMLALPVLFPTTNVGEQSTVDVVIQNTGEQPLTITGVAIGQDANDAPSSADFSVVTHTCGGNVPPGQLAGPNQQAVPRGTCTVTIAYKPLRGGSTSVARLQVTSNADDATERVLLVGRSNPTNSLSQDVTVGGDVAGNQLALSIPTGPWSFGTFQPGVMRNYDMNLAAQVIYTGDGASQLSVFDPSSTFQGHLVNGTDPLDTPLHARSPSVAEPNPAYVPLNSATPVTLRSFTGPVAGGVQIALRQPIGAEEGLRAGTYGKTLTFTMSTTTP